MKFPDSRILIFAKAPIPGQCKTRLIPALGAAAAAKLHQQLLIQTLHMASQTGLCPIELWCHPTHDHDFFLQCAIEYPLTLHQQQGHDLGQRMHHAIDASLQQSRQAILIGSDCPVITTDYLRCALTALEQKNDAVIGPVEDGGYVLIGLQRSASYLFNQINWGSNQVFEQTQQRLKQLNFKWHELETLWDIDRIEDWLRYQEHKKQRQT